MCLAVPMEIIRLLPENKAIVQNRRVSMEADISLLENPQPGEFTIIHAGFALEKIDPTEAEERTNLFDEVFGGAPDGGGPNTEDQKEGRASGSTDDKKRQNENSSRRHHD